MMPTCATCKEIRGTIKDPCEGCKPGHRLCTLAQKYDERPIWQCSRDKIFKCAALGVRVHNPRVIPACDRYVARPGLRRKVPVSLDSFRGAP